MTTIHDVARLAGVSAGTVSNVLNRPSYVGPAIRRRVLDAIDELGYQPRSNARRYRVGRERTLGLALADMGNPFFVDLALGAEAAAKAAGVGVVTVHDGEDVEREEQNLDLLVQQRVHGIMIAPVDERNPRLGEIIDRGVPVVFVDRISGDRPCCWLAVDDRQGGRLAGQHLASLGHRRIAFVGSESISPQVAERHDGFAAALAEHGISGIEWIEAESWRLDCGKRIGVELAARKPAERPTAIFCANDLLALGAQFELVRRGVDVPGDVSLIGFDDLTWAAASIVPLTTIRQPRAELGREAVGMILDEIENGAAHVHRHLLLSPELVIRESTAPPRS